MIWEDYLKPVDLSSKLHDSEYGPNQLGSILTDYNAEEIAEYDVVLISVAEDRASQSNNSSIKGEEFRKQLYELFYHNKNIKVADLGNIEAGAEISDTYFAVQECVSWFLKHDVIPLVIGGTSDLGIALYRAFGNQEQLVNITAIDSTFRLGEADQVINSSNVLSKLLLEQPNILFNYSNLAYQSYLVDPKAFELLDELFFDIHRLGEIKSDIKNAEPIIRNADLINFSLSAIAQPFAPANKETSPNGLTAEEACQLSRYAGINDKLSAIGLYDYNPSLDTNEQTAKLIAQMVWYFIEGFYQRKGDFPKCNTKEYTKYTVAIDEAQQELVFYKSPKSDRWWMEVPYHSGFRKKYARHLMLPCNYQDYQTAMENEIPERWFKTYQKLK